MSAANGRKRVNGVSGVGTSGAMVPEDGTFASRESDETKRANESWVWTHTSRINKIVDGVPELWTKCLVERCEKSLKFCGTSNVARHLRSKHHIQGEPDNTGTDQERAANALNRSIALLMRFFCAAFLPFSLIDNTLFRKYVNPSFLSFAPIYSP